MTASQRKPHLYWKDVFNPLEAKGGGFGCSRVSPGCTNCWSSEMNNRFRGRSFDQSDWDFVLNAKKLTAPLRARTPKTYFVCNSMDLFHHSVPDEFIHRMFQVMIESGQHTHLVLTKRIERAVPVIEDVIAEYGGDWLPPHIYIGTTIEDQKRADQRLPHLIKIPAKRWVSCEPYLERIFLYDWREKLDWVVLGVESGPRRRHIEMHHCHNFMINCRHVDLPLFVKQLDIDGKCVHDIEKFPASLRVRELPWLVEDGRKG